MPVRRHKETLHIIVDQDAERVRWEPLARCNWERLAPAVLGNLKFPQTCQLRMDISDRVWKERKGDR